MSRVIVTINVILIPLFAVAQEKKVSIETSTSQSIVRLGGKITFAPDSQEGTVVGVDLSDLPVTDRDLRSLPEMPHLRTLNLTATQVSRSGLKTCLRWKGLRSLDLTATTITDTDLKILGQFKKLERLILRGTSIWA